MSKILSIIVPVYNAEKYIQQCLESIFLNLKSGIEVIIVDDGSTDDTLKLVKQFIKNFAKNDDKIKLLTQFNQGQSVARNNALAISKGRYIAFIDADDYISSEYLNKILQIIEEENPDLIKIGAKKFLIDEDNNFQELSFDSFSEKGLKHINSELLKNIYNDNYWYACLTLLKKELIIKKFPIGIYFEDAVFMSDIYSRATNIYFLPDKIYYYRFHINSSLNNNNDLNKQKIEKSYKFCLNYFSSKMNENEIFGISYITFLKSYCVFLLQNRKFFKCFSTHLKHKNNIKKISYQILTKNSIIYYRKFGFFIIFLIFIKGVLS